MTKTVLVIEDDPDILQLAEVCLSLKGYAVDSARDGPEGLIQIKQTHPDLILLDLMLPSLDGLDVAKQIRSDPSFQDTPIVIMSVREPTPQEAGLCNGYIPKPFNLGELLGAVRDKIGG